MKFSIQRLRIGSISALLRCFVFIAFFFLSARSVFVYLSYLTGILHLVGIIALGVCIVLCWWKTIWVLYLFVAFIPLISGIQTLGFLEFAPLLSFIFSIIYLTWFLKRAFWDRKGFLSQSTISNFIDMLSGIVCISIIVCLCDYPLCFSLYRLKYASIAGQEDPFWFMEASYRILQGLFLYRVFDLEVKTKKVWEYFIPCLYCHAITIIVFSFIQFIFNIPDQKGLGSIFSPFQEIHSYGGYVLILFFCFTYPVLKKNEYTKKKLLLVVSLFFCILISGSTSTLILLLIIGSVLSLAIYGKQKNIFIIASIVLAIIVGINLFPSLVPEEGHNAIQRYVQRLNFSTGFRKLEGRILSADQGCGIIKEFPLTGSGVGSFFKISRYYHLSGKAHPERVENAHNYYLQFCAELGIPALFLFFMVLFFIYRTGLRSLKNFYITGLLFGISAFLLSMLVSHHLILSPLQFLFWFVLFVISSPNKFSSVNPDELEKQKSNFQTKYLPILLFVLFFSVVAGHAFNMFYFQKKLRGPYEYGFYESEKIEKRSVRWTMEMSGSKEFAETDIIGIRIYAMPDKVFNKRLTLDIFIDKTQIDSIHFSEPGFTMLYYHIPGIKDHEYMLRTKASMTFNPYKLGLTRDLKQSRDQGVAMERIRYLKKLPKMKYKEITYATIGE